MKQKILLLLSIIAISCGQNDKDSNTIKSSSIVEKSTQNNEKDDKKEGDFSIENVPYSEVDLGDFPFISLPEGLQETNKPLKNDFDICFFPINSVMIPFEGKLYKTFISPNRGGNFSQHFFEKSMADYLESLGATNIFDGEISHEEYLRYHKKDPNKGGEGDMGYAGQNMKFWIIRTKDKGNVYIQYLSNNAGATLNVLQEDVFKRTITKVTADKISKDLEENGKSILYINFNSNQSTISAEGKEVVKEIIVVLQKNETLKIAIEGHTDNTGDAAYNKKLSVDRANSVLSNLIANGIDKSRLSANGFGAEKPLVANDSEENKFKNRRVELVKI